MKNIAIAQYIDYSHSSCNFWQFWFILGITIRGGFKEHFSYIELIKSGIRVNMLLSCFKLFQSSFLSVVGS